MIITDLSQSLARTNRILSLIDKRKNQMDSDPVITYLCRENKRVGKKESYKFLNCPSADVEAFALGILNLSVEDYFLSREYREDYPIHYCVRFKFVNGKKRCRTEYKISFVCPY